MALRFTVHRDPITCPLVDAELDECSEVTADYVVRTSAGGKSGHYCKAHAQMVARQSNLNAHSASSSTVTNLPGFHFE